MATTVKLTDLTDYYQADATQDMPDYTALTSTGFCQDGDPVAGKRATLMGAAWFNLLAAMRVSVIKAAGLTPSKTPDPLQFLTALQSMAWMQDKKISTAMLADALVTAAKLNANAVETAKIKDKAVTTAKLADSAVTATQLAKDSVTVAKILAGTITFDRLAAAAIATQEQAEAGTANNVIITPLRLAQALAAQMPPAVPTGMILPFAGTSIPEGFLACNGSNVSRTTYANLFSVIGTRYGSGDGSTTFTLPNLHRRFAEYTTTLSEVGSSVQAGLPNITGTATLYRGDTHPFGDFSVTGAFSKYGNPVGTTYVQTDRGTKQSGFKLDASLANQIFGDSQSVQPASIRFLPCIKS